MRRVAKISTLAGVCRGRCRSRSRCRCRSRSRGRVRCRCRSGVRSRCRGRARGWCRRGARSRAINAYLLPRLPVGILRRVAGRALGVTRIPGNGIYRAHGALYHCTVSLAGIPIGKTASAAYGACRAFVVASCVVLAVLPRNTAVVARSWTRRGARSRCCSGAHSRYRCGASCRCRCGAGGRCWGRCRSRCRRRVRCRCSSRVRCRCRSGR